MKDKTPAFVEDKGSVQSGGLHCQTISCVTNHAAGAANHAAAHISYATHFFSWLFG